MFEGWFQLKAILWKNWLQKKAHFAGFLGEIFLPVGFMALLIMIKSITSVYNSPTIAYHCGNVFPWFYNDQPILGDISNEAPYVCTQKPSVCTTGHYYRGGLSFSANGYNFSGYSEYGYIDSAFSSGMSGNPFYTYMLAEDTPALYENPSHSLCFTLYRMQANHAILALAPASANDELRANCDELKLHILQLCVGTGIQPESVQVFSSQNALDDYVTDRDYDDSDYKHGKVAFAIVLYAANYAEMQWDYAVRVNYTSPFNQDDPSVACLYGDPSQCPFTYSIPSTKYYTMDLLKPQSAQYLYGYTYSAFSTLQIAVDEYILSLYNGDPVSIRASAGLMPTESFKSDDFQFVISSTLGIFYMLSFLYPVSRIIRSLVLEKELRIKEGMKMMGLTDTVYNMSWLITTVLQMTLVSVLITLVTGGSVFEYSNKVLVFLYFEVFSLAVIALCFLLATLFSRSKTASLLGPMIFFASFFPYYAVNDPQFDMNSKAATCLLAPACFALGANVFADFEGGLVGVQADNTTQETSNFSYSACLGMMFFDAVLYGALAWYLDKVFPSEFGTSLPWYFPLSPSYWCGGCAKKKSRRSGSSWTSWLFPYSNVADDESALGDSLLDEQSGDSGAKNSKYFETVSAELRQQVQDEKCVSIRGLRRVFKNPAGGDDRVAVSGLDLDLYQGQVSVLLGHNGAGKTTTISMLVGMIPPTAGDATMPEGLRISEDMARVRQNLGVCPQHDILFPELTALQHLQIFAAFKGVPPSQVNDEANKMIVEVGLREKANSKSSTLSGGQKRKLSLGIALIGGSKVVILDEPTSGMDPFSRRSTWSIIQRNKKGRVILLTTHFMDEADLLGDRVAIMAHGKLQCCGSPLFLKSCFGVGYTLTVVKEGLTGVDSVGLKAVSAGIESLVRQHVAEAEPLSDVGAEQSFRLPFSAAGQFVDLFAALDARTNDLRVAEYGISVTTLEEVFIRVGEMEAEAQATGQGETETERVGDTEDGRFGSAERVDQSGQFKEDSQLLTQSPSETDSDGRVFLKHFSAMLVKRGIYGKRDRRMLVCQLVLPVLLVVVGLSLLLIEPNFNQPDLVLSPAKYNPTYSSSERAFVPMYVDPDCPMCEAVAAQFNGGAADSGVDGIAVPIVQYPVDSDPFDGCSRGAAPLFNMSAFLVDTPQDALDAQKGTSVYGAVSLANGTDDGTLVYNILVNGSAVHGVGIYSNLVHSAFFQTLTGNPSATITVRNHPLPQTYSQESKAATADAFVVSLFCMIAFCFVPASFAVFVVREREVKAKHQQVISGASLSAYWTSTFLFDTLSYLPTALLVIASMYAYGIDAYTKGDSAGAVALVLILFGPAIAAFTYCISFLFVSHSTAQVVVMFLNFLTGLCLGVVSFVLTTIPSTTEISLSLRYLFRLFPSFCLADSLAQLALCSAGSDCPTIDKEGYSFESTQGPFAWDIAGANITFLALELVVYFLIALGTEYALSFPSLLGWLYYTRDPGASNETEDEDVVTEARRVASGGADRDVVRIQNLRKVYPMNSRQGGLSLAAFCPGATSSQAVKVAVQNLSFGIPKGECFGFLGINGAGKTTTLSILSGEFPPSSGRAFIDGCGIDGDQSRIRRKIGYCPQFDALLELLTVREHLELYGRIKGLQAEALEQVVQWKLKQLDLTDFEHKTAGSLSGGNKRKLSVAIATVGDPSIVFLDEPSTGMDPVARRFMWKVIARMSTQNAQCSVILTTHSMEEAEALCTRIGVMVNGRLRCLGSAQHLKHRFGNGFEVNIKTLSPSDDELVAFLSDLRTRVPSLGATASSQSQSVNPMAAHTNTADVEAKGTADAHVLDSLCLARHDIDAIARTLSRPDRMQSISETGSGSVLHEVLSNEGKVSARSLLEWWTAEDVFEGLRDFMQREFSGRAVLLERSSAITFRYRVQRLGAEDEQRSATNALSEIFAKFEAAKSQLRVKEYSVGQTTLEQIFNQFAAMQDNPEVAMSGN